tara:strand:+ start:1698 stop:2318 length:621 start_codon:yes stop_codon:yes gene_type:complete
MFNSKWQKLEYSYTNTDLFEFPQKYQMTPFEGREFLSSYEKTRQKILDKIKNNQTVNSLSHTLKLLQKQFLIDIKSDQKIFVTSNQLSSILLRLQHQKETQQETKFIMALLKKFEIKKRIFSEYDHELKENSTDFKILTNYILLAAICAKKFQDNSNPKFLNTLLKLNDTICSQIDSINDVNNLSLIYYIINLELEYIHDLIRKTL